MRRLTTILFGCVALLAAWGCPQVTPDKPAREWIADGRTHSAQERWDDAVADCTEALRQDPKSREALVLRAHASFNNGDQEQALEDSQAALELQRDDAALLHFHAGLRRRRGELEAADKLDREANLVYAASPAGLYQRASAEFKMGDYGSARKHYESALKLEPHNSQYLNELAWLEATCPEAGVRDGHRAIELATEACQLTQWNNPLLIDTLAAAYAETGQFDKAVKKQQQAVDLVSPPLRERDGYLPRLRMYQENKQFRLGDGQ
jgi:serine/threonine-protein kinase